ncbi:MAG: polysaccharide biosynthesis C-terminal domain-containing protein [Syntrophothermus sp.]
MEARRLTRSLGWLWVGYLARALAYFGLILVFTRSLGAAGFGVLSLFLAVTLGVSQLAGSWPFLAVPVLSARGRSIAAAFRPSLYVALVATAASLVVAIPVSIAIGIDSPISLFSIVASTLALVLLQGVFSVQQTEGRMAEIAVLQTAERVVALALALVAVLVTGLGVIGAQALLATAAILTCAAGLAVVGRRQHLFRRHPGHLPDHLVSTVLGAVGAMAIVSVCSYGVAWADVYILAAFRSNADVGIYSLAYQIFAFVTQLASYWLVVALPEHARSSAAGEGLREQLADPGLETYTGLWAALIATGAAVSGVLLPVVFGAAYEEAVPPLLLLLGGSGVFIAVYFAVLPGLIGAGRSDLVARVAVASVAVNVGLDIVLVPLVGIIGPALATFAQTLLAAAVLAWRARGRRGSLRLLAIGTPAAAATMLLAVNPTGPGLMALCLAAALASAAWAVSSTRRHGRPVDGADVGAV